MYRYKIRIEGSEYTTEEVLQDNYEIGEQVILGEQGGEVKYDENGEEVSITFPRLVYETIVAKEMLA